MVLLWTRRQLLYIALHTVLYAVCTGSGANKRTRLQQIIDWCGGESFDGCLLFDEAHKAKNFNAAKEESSTKVSQAVIAIQNSLPKARVVYCSATGVTDVGNLAYCERMGLWGVQTSFPNFAAFKVTKAYNGDHVDVDQHAHSLHNVVYL
jgi:P-loop containing NTP hydrolase pore-1